MKPLLIASGIAYTGTMVALSEAWYSDHERESFHFFNDNPEWLQIDKAGHVWSAFHLSSTSYEGLRWAGLEENKAVLWGAVAGFVMTLPVEWLDGYSAKYGASTGDILSNAAGSFLFAGQHALWNEVRIIPKFSFHHTGYAPMRPEVLGSNWSDRWLKDYNGQTYWLSFDLDKFIKSDSRILPFINLALGYGGEDFIYAREEVNLANGFNPRRQYYLSLDLDLTAIKTRNPWVKRLLHVVNAIHLPAPAISYEAGKLNYHYIYF